MRWLEELLIDLKKRIEVLETNAAMQGADAYTWTAPSMSNAWVNYGGTWATAGYTKDEHGFVHLKGLIKDGTIGSAAFTLPANYRPGEDYLFGTISNDAIGRVAVNTSGEVIPQTPSNNTWVSLDGLSFYAEN